MIDTSKLMTARSELERAVDIEDAAMSYTPLREIWSARVALDKAIKAIKEHRELAYKARKYRN